MVYFTSNCCIYKYYCIENNYSKAGFIREAVKEKMERDRGQDKTLEQE